MAGVLQVLNKGNQCVAVVQNALDDIKKGRVSQASEKLRRLKEDSTKLASLASQLATRLNSIEQHYVSEVEKIQKKIGDLGCKEEDLEKTMGREKSYLESHRNILRENESKLRSAQSDVKEAERNLQKAYDDQGKGAGTGAIIGAVVGLPFFGVGALFGAALGASIGAIVEACEDKVSEAKSNLDRRENDKRRARSDVYASEARVSDIQSEIRQLRRQIEDLKDKRHACHEKIDGVKSAIILLKKSVEFWKLFEQTSQHGHNRTTLLENIVRKANEKGKFAVLTKSGSKRMAATFLEAWESLEAAAAEGSSSHVLEIEFRCAYCGRNYTALPYVDESKKFVCLRCSRQYAIKNWSHY